MSPENQMATLPPTSPWMCGTGPAQAAGGQPIHNTLYSQVPQCPPPTFAGCPPAGNQPYTLHGATLCTQVGGCTPPAAGGAQPQMSTAFTTCTQPVVCQPQHNVSVPPHCPTVYPMCAPPANGGQAQPQFPTWPVVQCTVITGVVDCGPPNAGIQAPAQGSYYTQQCGAQAQGSAYTVGCPPPAQPNQMVSVPPHCPTVYPMCPPPATGNQAQAQGSYYTQQCGGQAQAGPPQGPPPSMFPPQCPTIFPHCGPGSGAQAQGAVYTLFGCQPTQHVATCTTIAGYTHNPPQCPPPAAAPAGGAAPAGAAYTQYPFGCTTVTSTPTYLLGCQTATAPPAVGHTQLPACNILTVAPTNVPGCTGVTGTPATVAHTHLMGCTTVTSAPVQAQGIGWTSVQYCTVLPPTISQSGSCGQANAPANAGGQAQAQTQFPTIPPTVCAVTVVAGCGHVTGIPYVC